MAEGEPRLETPEELFGRKVELRLREEVEGMEYKGIAEKFGVFISFEKKFTRDLDWTIYQNTKYLTSVTSEYQNSLAEELRSMRDGQVQFRQHLLINKISAILEPAEIRRLAANQKVESIIWNDNRRQVA